MKIAKKLFQTVCLAALFLSAGFLLYHMVYLPMENKKLVAELKGNWGCRTNVRQLILYIQHKTPSFEKPGVRGIISLCD